MTVEPIFPDGPIPGEEPDQEEELFDDDDQPIASEPPEFGKPGDVARRTVTDEQSGWRLDLFLVHHFPQYSRSLLRNAIQSEGVFVDGKRGKPAYRLVPGQEVTFTLIELPRQSPVPEDIPLEVLYEDDDLAVINKPPDMVVHPSRGHWSGTLVGALSFRYAGALSSVRGPTRPGVVHRLDRDTSGAILVAKNDVSHARLATQFECRKIHKEYYAIVLGNLNVDRDVVDLPIAHHPKFRDRMCVARDDPDAKPAVTYIEVKERFRGFSTVIARPQTGRTHQIRVHLTHSGCPILCDKQYGGRSSITLGEIVGTTGLPATSDQEELQNEYARILLARQALHAHSLTFEHPTTGKEMTIEAPLPNDIVQTLDAIRQYRKLS